MRIEKISDTQIRCILNKKDLADRELRISELAYGSDKAKSLFQDMMQQASYEFGFEANDIPLMIEAVPTSPDSLILVITKVSNPDELDTRFSHFTDDDSDLDFDEDEDFNYPFEMEEEDEEDSQGVYDSSMIDDEDDNYLHIPDDMGNSNLIIADNEEQDKEKNSDFISLSKALGMEHRPKTSDYTTSRDIIKIYSFETLQDVTSLAEYLVYSYHGNNTLYKDSQKGLYYLVVHKSEHAPEEFNKICNTICEYGKPVWNSYASHSFYKEHFSPMIKDKALQVLASI